MLEHHAAWLSAHPHRSPEWLAERIRDGADIHHVDGNRANNDPSNLVLIDGADHMMLHGGTRFRRGVANNVEAARKPRRNSALVDGALRLVANGWRIGHAAEEMGIAKSSLCRAMRRLGIAPRKAGRPRK